MLKKKESLLIQENIKDSKESDLTKAKQQIANVADKTEQMGNTCFEIWEKGKNLNVARTGIAAFKTVLHANGLLIRAKTIEG